MSVFFTDTFLYLNNLDLRLTWQEAYELAKYVVTKKEEGMNAEILQLLVERVLMENVREI